MAKLNLLRIIRLGVKNLLLHKLRSALTMLGVVFGVGSVVAMLAVGEGASKEAMDQIKKEEKRAAKKAKKEKKKGKKKTKKKTDPDL